MRWASPAARPVDCWPSSARAPRPSSCTPVSPRSPASSPPAWPPPEPPDPRPCSRARTAIFDALAAGTADPHSIVEGLGERWETTRIGIKPYAACQLSHATLDALRDARRQGDFSIDDIESITAQVHPDSASVVCDTSRDLTRPASPYAAKFSLPWSAAALLVDGDMTLATFDPASITRPDVTALAARVTVELAPTGGVAADAPGAVRIVLRDGRVVDGAVTRSAGGPDNPLTDEDLQAKLTGNVGAGSEALIAAIESFPAQPDLHHLLSVAAQTAADHSTR